LFPELVFSREIPVLIVGVFSFFRYIEVFALHHYSVLNNIFFFAS